MGRHGGGSRRGGSGSSGGGGSHGSRVRTSHEPLYVNENMPYANLFGHVHNSPIFKDFSKQHYCVSVERINYAPISFEEIKKQIIG